MWQVPEPFSVKAEGCRSVGKALDAGDIERTLSFSFNNQQPALSRSAPLSSPPQAVANGSVLVNAPSNTAKTTKAVDAQELALRLQRLAGLDDDIVSSPKLMKAQQMKPSSEKPLPYLVKLNSESTAVADILGLKTNVSSGLISSQ